MERVSRRKESAEKALRTLKDISREPFSIVVRDAAIQRFEYTFEAFWKLIREYLREYEGIRCNSPKSCFREALSSGLINEEQVMTCLEMTDDRNLTSHTYMEEVAKQIYRNVETYCELMDSIFNIVEKRLEV